MTTRRTLLYAAPLAVAAVAGAGFYTILRRMQTNDYDPHALPSPLIGKHPPAFTLPGLTGGPGFSNTDLLAPPRPMIVNWFASWCIPCAQEAEMLGSVAAEGIPVWGIAYKDTPAKAAKFLDQYGNPYQKIADDRAGLVGIDWGIDGVPESFLIDRAGIVRWHIGGPLTDDTVRDDLRPALKAVA